MAASSLLGTVLGQQATVALVGTVLGEQATMATVAGNRAGITTDEGDGHDRDEHREGNTEIPLHQNLQLRNRTRKASKKAVTN